MSSKVNEAKRINESGEPNTQHMLPTNARLSQETVSNFYSTL